MTTVLWADNTNATLASGITSSQTTITLTGGQGAQFPSPTTGQIFPVTIQSASNANTYEITYCTSRSTDTLTVIRAQEGTTGQAFNAGDIVQNRPTAGTLVWLTPTNNLSDLTSDSTARTNLGLGTMAVQNANAVAITGGTAAGLSECAINTTNNAAGFSATAPNPVYEWIDHATGNAWVFEQNSSNAQLNVSFNSNGLGTFDHISGVYTATSDIRLKQDIEPLGDMLALVEKLNPVNFSFKADNSKRQHIGLIAQEVQALFPEFVFHVANKSDVLDETDTSAPTRRSHESDGIDDKLGLNYAGLSVIALKAIQELMARITALENEVAALKAR